MNTSRHEANEEKNTSDFISAPLRALRHFPRAARGGRSGPHSNTESQETWLENPLEHREAKEGGCSPSNRKNQPPSPPGPLRLSSRSGHLTQPCPPHSLSSQEAAGQDGILLARLLHKSFPTLHPPCEKTLNGEGNGNPLQYSCLETPMDGGTC